MNADKLKPVPKISAVAFGSAIGLIITIFFTKIDAVGAAALTGALGTIAGYLMPTHFPWNKGG